VSTAESDALHARVQAFIRASLHKPLTEGFDEIALDLARFQAATVPAFARLVRARGIDLTAARTASAIPAVPTDVFKLTRVAAHPSALDTAVFRTSGTTVGDRGEHALRRTDTYELGALGWGARFLWPDGPTLGALILAPPASAQPDSSPGFMLDLFARHLAGPCSWHVEMHGTEARIDVDGLVCVTAEARAKGRATIVLATSFALVHLLDQAAGRDLRLPAGSRVMQTGGFKGRSREVDPATLRAMVADAFALRHDHVVSEYGMTELSSQLYEGALACIAGAAGVHHAPPWVRVVAVDPVSLEPVARGEVGLGRIVDLANVDSAVAIQTADRVRVGLEGEVTLLGRMPGAAPRGCSIAIDEMLGAR
jgi:Acyl-protein synthetase, LuxE